MSSNEDLSNLDVTFNEAFRGYGVTIAYAQLLFDFMRQRGHEPARVCAPLRLQELLTADASSRCSLNEWHGWMGATEYLMGCPHLALALSEQFRPWHLGLVGFMVMTSGTLLDASKVLQRYHHLVNDMELVESQAIGDRFAVTVHQVTSLKSPRVSMITLGSWIWQARWLTGRADLAVDVDFDFPQPADTSAFERVFGGKVRFAQPQCAMRGPLSYLKLQVIQRDPNVNRILCEHAARQMAANQLTMQSGFLSQLERQIASNLGHADISLSALATALQISPRTLQNRMEAAGVSFRALVIRVRKHQAMQYLGDSQLSLRQIAVRLGFSTQTGFQHAFKRWTGQSPGEYRRPKGDGA
ncbi:MAG: AraC family transcriptional regulator ligand-binding domain-containing protein [Aquabacterium sp.]